jgi:hypothetical protein
MIRLLNEREILLTHSATYHSEDPSRALLPKDTVAWWIMPYRIT